MELHNRHIILGLALAFVVVATVGVLAWNHTSSEAAGASPEMHLGASGTGVTCQGSSPDMTCTVANLSAGFSVKIFGSCCNPGSAGGFQSELYGVSDLGYAITTCTAEVTMTPETLCLGPAIGVGGQVSHGNSTGLLPPVPAWTNPPDLVDVTLNCGGAEGLHSLVLTKYDLNLNNLGSQFSDLNGTSVYVKQRGTAMVDTDGPGGNDPVDVPVADKLTIQCGTPPTPTNTPCAPEGCPTAVPATATRTPTITPLATMTPVRACGDVNGDTRVNSVDASLILQKDAGLLPSLMYPEVADVNDDGNTNSLDALLVLQFNGGLVSSLNC